MTLTATAIQYPELTPTLWSAPPDDAQHICRLTIGVGQQVWLGDEDVVPAAQLPAGSVWINAPIAAKGLPGTISMTPGLTTGEQNISKAVYKFLDDLGEFDTWLQNKAANNLQLFGGTLEHFIIERGDVMDTEEELNRGLWYTWQIKGKISLDKRVYSVRCEDINRDAERDIFEKRSHTLMSALQSGTETAQIYLTEAEAADLATASWLFEHGDDYHVHPGETRAIGLLSDSDAHEYISWTGVEDSGTTEIVPDGFTAKRYTLLGLQRGLFGTVPREWTFDSTKALGSRRTIEAVPYAEEHPLSLARAAYTGKLLDGRTFPWGLSIDQKWMDAASLSLASMESYQLRITIRSPEKQTAKRFVEEHCLARRGILVTNPTGAQSYVPVPIGTGEPVITLNEDNCYGADAGDLDHDESDTATSTIISWDKDPITGKFRKKNEFIETAALGETSALDSETVEAPYLTTNRSTEGEVLAQARVLHARHARPVKRITLKPDWSLAHYAPGTVTQVDLPIIDYANKGVTVGYISMPMMVASIQRNHHDEQLTWKMIGFRPLPAALTNLQTQQLPEAEYMANGTLLTVNNSIASTSQIIDLTKKYYFLDDVTLPSGWPSAFTNRGDLELWVRGVLLWGADVDLSGLGGLGGSGSTASGSPGQRGAIPAPSPTGSVAVSVVRFENSSGEPQGITSRRTTSRPPSNLASRNGQTSTQLTASVERGRLVGIPSRLMGSGGAGGDGSTYRGRTEDGDVVASDSATIAGSGGGHGAASVKIVCSAGSGFVGNGVIRVNGEDGDAPLADKNGVTPAAGAGGARGQVAVFHDTPGTPWSFSSTTLESRNGKSVLVGDRAPSGRATQGATAGPIRSFYQPTQDTSNKWADAFTVQFLPQSEIAQDAATGSPLDLFLANQRDGKVSIIIQTDQPSDANAGDMWITPEQLNSGSNSPNASVFTGSEWRSLDWVSDNRVYAFLLFTAREYGGNTVHFGITRPMVFDDGDLWRDPNQNVTWILHTDGEDEVLTRDGVQVGDQRLTDPNFVLTATAGAPYTQHWYFTSDIASMPTVTVPGLGRKLSVDTLPPPFDVQAAVYGANEAELFWKKPSDRSQITAYEVTINGASVDTVADIDVERYLHQGLIEGSTYTLGVRSIGANSTFSQLLTKTVTMDSDATVPLAITGVTVSGGYTIGEPGSQPSSDDPTITLGSAGPTIVLDTTNVEDTRGMYLQFTGGYTVTIPVSGNQMTHTPSDPGALAGQSFSAFVQNDAGLTAELNDVAYVSS